MSEDYSAATTDYLAEGQGLPAPSPAAQLHGALTVAAAGPKPDYEADLRRASAATGVPLPAARAYPKEVQQQARVLSFDPTGMVYASPHMANFLSNPDNAAVALDDTSVLAHVEQTLKNLGNLGKASFFAAASGSAGFLQEMSPTMRSLGISPGDALGGEFDDPKSPMGEYLTALRHASKAAATRFTPQTDNPWAAGVNNGVVNLMQAAPITAAAVLTKNPGIAMGAFGALAGGEGYGDAKDAGKSDATAQRYAGTQGAIAMLAQAIPLHQLLGDVAEGTGFFKTLGKNMLLSQPAMQAQTLASDFDTWQTLNPDKPVSEFLKERGPAAVRTMVMTAVGDVGNTAGAHAVGKLSALASSDGENGGKAVQAQQAGVILQQLAEAAEASKLRDRDPQAFHDFVAKATADGPVETLYVDPRKITDILAQGDPEKLADSAALLRSMPSVLPQMDEALRTGQDIEIPTSEFAAFAAGSTLAQDLIPHLKTDPNGMSMHESQAFLQSHAEDLKAQVQKIVAESGQDDATQASSEKVRQSILAELTAANRFTPDVNEAYSHLTAAFYATQAHRLGITPEELHAQYPVKIAAEGVGDTPPASLNNYTADTYHAQVDELAATPKTDFLHDVLKVATRVGVYLPEESISAAKWAAAHGRPDIVATLWNQAKTMKDETTASALATIHAKSAPGVLAQDGKPPGYEPGLGFKSKLAEAVDKGPGKAPAAQWEATLRNTPGVKKEELEWLGVPEFLKTAGEHGPVTKEDVQAFVAQHGVQLEEKVLGGVPPSQGEIRSRAVDLAMAADERDQEGLSDEELEHWTSDNTWHDFADLAEEELRDESGVHAEAKFDDYKLPGGTNYREVLLTMPTHGEDRGHPNDSLNPGLTQDFTASHWDDPNVIAHTRLTDRTTPDGKKVLFVEEVQSDWHQKGRDQGYANPASPEERAAAEDALKAAEKGLDDAVWPWAAKVLENAEARKQEAQDEEEAFLRKADAIQAEREKLAAEHIPAGGVVSVDNRWKGPAEYAQTWEELTTARRIANDEAARVAAAARQLGHLIDNLKTSVSRGSAPGAMRDGGDIVHGRELWGEVSDTGTFQRNMELRAAHQNALLPLRLKVAEAAQAREASLGNRGIPNAPFKTSWPALVMKRIMRLAAEGGYDHVAWTTGEQQADRYNLAAHVGDLGVMRTDDPERVRVSMSNRRAEDAVREHVGMDRQGPLDLTQAQLREVFGGALGDQIWSKAEGNDPSFGWTMIDHNDFRVGGEGMKAFYDRNLVNITNDLIKKFGGKVEPTAVHADTRELREAQANRELTPEEEAELKPLDDAVQAARQNYDRVSVVPPDSPAYDREAESAAAKTWNDALQKLEDFKNRTLALKQPGFEITPEMRKAAQEGLALFQGDKNPRGSFDPNTNLISLLKGADLSTYLHESGHFYLETLARVAATHPDSEVAQDMDKALAFMGHKGQTAADWLALPLDERRDGHELFARGFEAYLMEGKAPSQELRGVFQRFRSWLVSVYKTVAGLKVDLTDDVRGVFDRMLASDQQIEDHQTALGFHPMFKDAVAAGMNPQEWAAYQRLGADATASAVDQLETRSIRDMRWASGAKDRAVARLQREAATKRKAMTSEVTAEVMAEPINRARQLLKFGLLDGQEQEGNTKLSLPALREMYGEGGTPLEEATGQNKPKVPYRELGFGKYGMLAEDGVHPDHVAELLGFSSGDELVRQLLTAEPAKVTIEGKTDQRMLERYGDLVDRDSIDKAADEAIHNDARLRFVATEANALAKATGGKRVLAEAAKGYADNMVGGVKVRELRPVKYQVAESRAAKAAEKAAAKGDLVGAATEKRNQVINGYAARAAQDAQAEIAKAVRFFAKFASAGTRKALDPDYRDQIDSLLERFDLSKNTTLRAIDKRKSLAAWVERMKANDQEPMIPEDLLNEAYRKSYKDMTVDEVRGLRDTVRQIEHLARLKNKLLSAKDARNFADTIEATTTEVEKSAIGKPRDLTESNQIGDKVEAGARGFSVMHRKFDSLITRLAGFVDKRDPGNASTLWSVLVRPKNEAADREATRLQKSTEELQRIFKALAPDRVRQKVFIPEINNSLSLEGRLAVLLNWGNEGNRQRVIDGDHWTDAQVQAIFKTLEPRHFAFAQELLDHVNSFKGEVAAAHRRRYGVEPPMIEAAPFEAVASDGSTVQMRGGYYPIKYDANRSAKAADFDVIKETKRAIVGSTRGFVKAGFYKAREDTVENRPVSKSFNAAFSHLTEVIHDLEWGDYLIDAKRLLHNETLGNSIRVHAGPEILQSLKNSVQAMEVGDIPAQNAFQKAIQYLNTGTTLAGLGWNFIVSTKHPLGLFNGAARIGPKWIGVGLKRWIGDAASLQNTVEWVHSKSEFMKSRAHGRLVTRDLQDVSGKMTTGLTSDLTKMLGGAKAANALHATGTAVEHSFYWMIERGQMIADIPTWIGQYEKSMEAHGDDAKAVQQANQAVRDSQTTGGFSDLPEIQRGGPLMKLFTKFYSYFTVVYNQLAESAEETRFRGVSNVPALAGDVMLALILPALAGATIQRFLPGGDQRDDWAKYLGQHLLADMFGTMIGVRDMYAAFTEDKDAPGGFRFMKNTADLGKQIEGGHTNTPQFWKALNAEGGVLFHYPSATVQRFVTGMQAMADGQTHNPLVVLTGPHPKPRP